MPIFHTSAIQYDMQHNLKMHRRQLILNPQILTARLASRVKVRCLTDAHSAVPAALANVIVV